MKAKINSFLRAVCHPIVTVACAGVVLLIASSALAQNLFVAEAGNNNITEITPSGVKSTFATGLNYPDGLAFNSAGDLFVANGTLSPDTNALTITKITPDGTKSIFATTVSDPRGLAFDSAGNLFVVSAPDSTVTEIAPDGTQSPFASGFSYARGAAFDSVGDLFVGDEFGSTIYEFTAGGVRTTFTHNQNTPTALAFNSVGNLFASDFFGEIYEITPEGVQTLFSMTSGPTGLAFNSAGDLFVADQYDDCIYEITPGGALSIFASGLNQPMALAFEPSPALAATVTNGVIQVGVTMPSPYHSTIVQVSTDMVNWTSVCTNTPPFTFTDSMGTSLQCRFYRAMLGP